MVVYDPNDPNASLYDVDDGKSLLDCFRTWSTVHLHLESTVITLADWYHTLARQGAKFPYVT